MTANCFLVQDKKKNHKLGHLNTFLGFVKTVSLPTTLKYNLLL